MNERNTISKRSFLMGLTLPVAMAALPWGASASDAFPKSGALIKLVVPYAAGGGTDAMARAIAPHIAESLGVQVIVDNRPGAGTLLGSGYAARERADGHTILVTTTALLQAPSAYAKVPFDPIKDFIPLAILARVPLAFAVPANSPAKTVQDYVRLAKADSKSFAIGNYGTGTLSHIQGAMFSAQAKLDLAHVAYKGASPLAADIAGGHVGGGFVDMSSLPLQKAGRLRYLAVSGTSRLSFLPDVPTMKELGYKDYEIFGWAGMFLPAGTPTPIVEKLSAAIHSSMQHPTYKARLQAITYEPGGLTRQEFADMCKRDIAQWDRLFKSVGIQPQ